MLKGLTNELRHRYTICDQQAAQSTFVHQTLGVSCIVVNTASSTFRRLRVSSWDHHLDVTVQIVFVLNFSSLE